MTFSNDLISQAFKYSQLKSQYFSKYKYKI